MPHGRKSMNETKRFETRELTQEEKERILKEFKQLLAERNDYISIELAEALKPTGLGWNMCEILKGLTYRYLNK